MSEYIKYYSILCAVEFNYILFIVTYLQWASTRDANNLVQTQNTAAESMNAESTNEGWDIMRSDTAFYVGTQEIIPFMFCSFPFIVRISCCAYAKEGFKCSNVSLHFFNLNQTAWGWQWNLWSSIYLDFRFSYQLSWSEEHRWYLMLEIVFIFAVHLSLFNFKIFFVRASNLLRLQINILYTVTLLKMFFAKRSYDDNSNKHI